MNDIQIYRAESLENGKIVEGYPVKYPSGKVEIHVKCEFPPDMLRIHEVKPETVTPVKAKKRCDQYVGVACVDGSCPVDLRDELAERGIPITRGCDDCYKYKGCEDCALDGTPDCPEKKKPVTFTEFAADVAIYGHLQALADHIAETSLLGLTPEEHEEFGGYLVRIMKSYDEKYPDGGGVDLDE